VIQGVPIFPFPPLQALLLIIISITVRKYAEKHVGASSFWVMDIPPHLA